MTVTIDNVPGLKSATVVRGTFPTRGEVLGVGVTFSRDGINFQSTDAQGGLARHHEPFWSVREDGGKTTVLALVFARPENGVADFLFDELGTYYFHLHVTFRGREGDPLDELGRAQVTKPGVMDGAFVQRLAEPTVLRDLFGRDVFADAAEDFNRWIMSKDGSDYRAIMVINEFLEATRLRDPQDMFGSEKRTPESALVWADTLWPLAQEFPDSSYAPYTAFYAGMCYWALSSGDSVNAIRAARIPGARKDQVGEFLKRGEILTKDDRYAKGAEGLQFAVEHGDAYLKPVALYHLGSIRACGGKIEAAEKLFGQAIELGGERGTIGDMVGKFRSELEKTKQALAERNALQTPSGRP